jgi:alpha-glucosidase
MMPLLPFPAYALSIHHDGSARYVRPHATGALRLGDEVTLRVRAAPDAPIERLILRTCPDGEQLFTPMRLEGAPAGQAACRWWQATVRLTMPCTPYRFLVFTADGAWWLNGAGLQRHVPTDAEDFRLLAGYAAPTWTAESIFYQIFPDRFADGDPAGNVREGEFVYGGLPSRARRWGQPPGRGREAMVEFFGGDLAGIVQRLPDLAELGVNALYLTPIFTAYSNHHYDVVDYEHVDPHLGGDTALVALRRATRELDFRYILDIVPNHCGVAHPWFQAAQADARAPTAEYFTFRRHPDDYESWLGVRSLPKLNYRSQALRQAMYAGPEAVFRRWLRPPYSADGWRIDVGNMLARQGADQLNAEIARDIRDAVKAENPAAYLLGENFFDGSPQLQGDGWDATMNYAGFTLPLWHWLRGFQVRLPGEPQPVAAATPWPTQALADTWRAFRAAIPWVIARQQFNLLGSHDTPRILTVVGGDRARCRLAAALLLTYIGVPCLYYGNEIGLGGADDLGARQCMPWDRTEWDLDLRAFYQALIRLRRSSPALREGGFQVLAVEEDGLAYLRDTDQEQVIVVAQRGPGARPAGPLPAAAAAIADGTEFTELFTGQVSRVTQGQLPLAAVPPGAQIWRSAA